MPKRYVTSTLDIVGWFCDRASKGKHVLSSKQLQNLLFLAQMHHTSKNGRVLVPAMFVCSSDGFYEPTTEVVLLHGLPLDDKKNSLTKDVELLLESVWQRYSSLSEQELREFITSLACWKNFYSADENVIINPLEISSLFLNSITKVKSVLEDKPKIRLSQNGPVAVSPWHPRKLNESTSTSKKEK